MSNVKVIHPDKPHDALCPSLNCIDSGCEECCRCNRGEVITHDELCGLSQPCDDEVPEHGYCSQQEGQFCIHCMTWCICWQVRYAKQTMLAKCIAVVEEMHIHGSHPFEGIIECNCIGPRVVANLRALQEKP